MSKTIKRAIAVLIFIAIVIIVTISSYFIVKNAKKKEQIDKVYEMYSDENIQETLQKSNDKTDIEEFMLKMNGENVIGLIKIEKIDFEGLVYEGTSLETLDKGVGHFESSPYLKGNVCLAAHNSSKFWAKLHTLTTGDKITYVSFLGTKEYQVTNVTQISETDWSKLENADEDILTLITCVKGKPALRLCVQGIEVH